MQNLPLFDEMNALGPMRVQKVFELFYSALVIELYAFEHGRLFLVFDTNDGSPSFHVQKDVPQGQKNTSKLVLTLRKHAIGRPLWIMHEGLTCEAIIAAPNEDLVLRFSFAPPRVQLVAKVKGTYEIPSKKSTSLTVNLMQAQKYEIFSKERFYNQALREQRIIYTQDLKKKHRLLKNIDQDLIKAQNILKNEDAALLIQNNLHVLKKGMKEALVFDYLLDPPEQKMIKLDERLAPGDYLSLLYKKIKKAKRGINNIEPRKEALLKEIALINDALIRLEETGPDLSLVPSKKALRHPKNKKTTRLPYRIFISSDQIPIWVGKSSKDNDALSLHYAHGNDWWLHAKSASGSHVVIKTQKDALPSATLIEAAMLAAHYSALCDENAPEVIYTRAKNIRKPKGLAPGKVIATQEKSLIVRMDAEILERLLKT